MTDLYLFDIDGTLVNIDYLHLNAYQQAYRDVLGVEADRDVIHSSFGMVEIDQQRYICRESGYNAGEKQLEELISVYYSEFNDLLKSSKISLLQGVADFLNELKRKKDYTGILTAHTESNGRAILKNAEIEDQFSVFGFLKEGLHTRIEIAKDVLRKAEEKGYGWRKVYVIGDSASDIKAAKGIGAISVGVCTSYTAREKLEEEGADLVIKDLTEYPKIFDLIN